MPCDGGVVQILHCCNVTFATLNDDSSHPKRLQKRPIFHHTEASRQVYLGSKVIRPWLRRRVEHRAVAMRNGGAAAATRNGGSSSPSQCYA